MFGAFWSHKKRRNIRRTPNECYVTVLRLEGWYIWSIIVLVPIFVLFSNASNAKSLINQLTRQPWRSIPVGHTSQYTVIDFHNIQGHGFLVVDRNKCILPYNYVPHRELTKHLCITWKCFSYFVDYQYCFCTTTWSYPGLRFSALKSRQYGRHDDISFFSEWKLCLNTNFTYICW